MRRGFTIAEITIAISLVAILGSIIVIEMNPFGQIASARNTQRALHLQAIMNAVRQNITESGTNSFTCATGAIPTTSTLMRATSGYDIAPCLLPGFLTALPFDPRTTGAHFVSATDYDTGYSISRDATSTVVTLVAPGAELGKTITLSR